MDLPKGSLYDSYVDTRKKGGEYKSWDIIKPSYSFDPNMPYSQIIVPT